MNYGINTQGGEKWIAEIRKQFPKYYKSRFFLTKQEALTWAVETENAIDNPPPHFESKTFKEALCKYRDEVSIHHKGAKWERDRINKILRSNFLNCNRDVNLVLPKHIQGFIDKSLETLKPDSVIREVTLLRGTFKYINHHWKWSKNNPFTAEIRMPKKGRARDRRITEEEIPLILEALFYKKGNKSKRVRHKIAIAFLFAIETAMRQGEIFKLKWENVFFDKRYCTLLDTKNVTSRVRHAYVYALTTMVWQITQAQKCLCVPIP